MKLAESDDDAISIMQELLDHGLILRVASINNTRFFQADLNRTWSNEAVFAWTFEGSQFWIFLGAVGLLLIAFLLVMFPLWPSKLRGLSWYVMILSTIFLVFLLVTSIIRLVVFAITIVFYKPGIWIFPNLYADCSFIDSFIPFWDWHKPASD